MLWLLIGENSTASKDLIICLSLGVVKADFLVVSSPFGFVRNVLESQKAEMFGPFGKAGWSFTHYGHSI